MIKIKIVLMIVILGFNSCATSAKFPVSALTPAAQISITKKTDKHKNAVISITAKHLASPQRLNPPGISYNVWVLTKDQGVKNVGQLNVKNAKETKFRSVTAFDFYEIFITVENQSGLQYPSGAEISRTKI